ncbi:thyrotropin-releasing hormone receptor-like isoform X2 [Glandiceps talaboti]
MNTSTSAAKAVTYVADIENVSVIMENLTQSLSESAYTISISGAVSPSTLSSLSSLSMNITQNFFNETLCGNMSELGNGSDCDAANLTPRTLAPVIYKSILYRVIWFLCWGLVLLCGIIGNTMVILVVCRINHMRTPTNCYLVSLAVADTLVLIVACLPTTIEIFLPTSIWLYGDVGCKLSVYLQYVAINVSSLSITAFTIERYIAICHPMKAQTMCTVSRAKKIISVLWIFAILYFTPWLFFVGTRPGRLANGRDIEWCDYKQDRGANIYNIMYFVDLCAFYISPSILSVVVYGLIAKILFSNTVPNNDTKESFRHKHKLNGVHGKRESKKRNHVASSRKQVIKMLVVVVVLFLTLWAPYRVLVVYNSIVSEEKKFTSDWYLAFAKWCIFLNSAINPILYNFMSVKFRRAFIRLCGCGRSYGSRPSRKNGIYLGVSKLHNLPPIADSDMETPMPGTLLNSAEDQLKRCTYSAERIL